MTFPIVLCLTACVGLLAGHFLSHRSCTASHDPATAQTHAHATPQPRPPIPVADLAPQSVLPLDTQPPPPAMMEWARPFLVAPALQDTHTIDILSSGGPNSLTVIVGQSQKNTLSQLLPALLAQPLPIDSIVVVQSGSLVDLRDTLRAFPRVKHIHNTNFDAAGLGRFCVPLYFNTSFIAVLDDDAAVGADWLSRALDLCKARSAVVGGDGVRLSLAGRPLPEQASRESEREADVLLRSWLFRREWVYHFWRDDPRVPGAEAVHFAASAKLYGRLPLWVLPMSGGPPRPPPSEADAVHYQIAAEPWLKRGWTLLTPA
eukprot:EG_transcript_17174